MKIASIGAKMSIIIVAILAFTFWGYSQETPSDSREAVKLAEGVYFLGDYDCNIAASVGPDGVLIIDSGSEGSTDQVLSALKGVTESPICLVIDTHFHFDHVGGNEAFASRGAMIIAHEQTRMRMTLPWDVKMLDVKWPKIQPYPATALPRVTFAESLRIYFNGEDIETIHLPAAHSDDNIVIRFKNANFIHTGDLFLSNGFPILDFERGGTIDGYLAAVDKIISLCDGKTVVMPGHGPISNREGLQSYRQMLAEAKERIVELIKERKTIKEILVADVTAGLYKGGQSWLDPKLFVCSVYEDLLRKH
jgi:cyclase